MGFNDKIKKIVEAPQKEIKRLHELANKVEDLEDKYRNMSDEELSNQTNIFKKRLENGETLDDIMTEAFATVREAALRTLGLFPYHVQIMGGIVLHEGNIPEMKTGEGKTLTATMPVYLNALSEKGVHVVTVNEYLSERDAELMKDLYNFLGLSVGVNLNKMNIAEKQLAYNCDITYSTNSELGFDYLKDNMVLDEREQVQRDLNFCIVDEVDSILIDEARTPLIISGNGNTSNDFYIRTDNFVKRLKEEVDYTIDISSKSIALTETGIDKAEKVFHLDNLYDEKNSALTHYIDVALKANYIMIKNIDYVVQDGEVNIVDSFTGRVMDGRRFSDGLHQAIEAKEGVEIKEETKTLASITYQNFFRMYSKLSGMTGTGKTEEEELKEIYNLSVIEIPTNLPIIRDDKDDLLYPTMQAKYKALVQEIKRRHATGQPILVGTPDVESSEIVSKMLTKEKIPHEVLNAKNHKREAEIITDAGQKGAITIATNMAGRGTDIKLGPGVAELGGLAVIGTERNESRRIDNQLRGRSGRQGDPGVSQFYLSLEDNLMKRFGTDKVKNALTMLAGSDDEDMVIQNKLITKQVEAAQKRVEGNNYDSRKNVLQYDDTIRQQRETIYKERNEVLKKEDSLKDDLIRMSKRVSSYLTNTNKKGPINETELDYINQCYFNKNEQLKLNKVQNLSRKECKEMLDKVFLNELENKMDNLNSDEFENLIKMIILNCVDNRWTEHIDEMEHLKQYVNLRSYAQNNPIVEYQKESFEMYNQMIKNIEFDIIKTFIHTKIQFY